MKNSIDVLGDSWVEIQTIARGKYYAKEYLGHFIKQKANYSKDRHECFGWSISTDELTTIRLLVLDYLVKKFTLKEIYIIFYVNQDGSEITYSEDARKVAINNINWYRSLTKQEAKRLKGKVSNINPILFGLITNLVHASGLFWDEERNEEVYPEFFDKSLYKPAVYDSSHGLV